jgi:tetratricopeptide (TPR) repeat protein
VLDCGRSEQAERHLAESLRLQQELGNLLGVAYALLGLAIVAWFQADLARARQYQEQRLAVERLLGNIPGIAHTLGSLGELAASQAAFAEADVQLAESLALYTQLGDEQGVVRVRITLAWSDMERGRYAEAGGQLQACLERAQACGFRTGAMLASELLATLALATADLERAAALIDACAPLAQAGANIYSLAANLRLQGELARLRGQQHEALRLLADSAEQYRSTGNRIGVARARAALGWALLDAGDPLQARAVLEESLGCFQRVRARSWEAWALEGLAAAAAESGRWEDAAGCWSVAEQIREQTGARRWPVEQQALCRRRQATPTRPHQTSDARSDGARSRGV